MLERNPEEKFLEKIIYFRVTIQNGCLCGERDRGKKLERKENRKERRKVPSVLNGNGSQNS